MNCQPDMTQIRTELNIHVHVYISILSIELALNSPSRGQLHAFCLHQVSSGRNTVLYRYLEFGKTLDRHDQGRTGEIGPPGF